jgi:uncharacterized repeat protein (TIGR03803 family)
LIQGIDGNFYGTTFYGGPHEGGTIYKLELGKGLRTLYAFGPTCGPDCSRLEPGCCVVDNNHGVLPRGGLLQTPDGTLYGTTWWGGATEWGGTVFKFDPALPEADVITVHQFPSGTGGPRAALIFGNDGGLFGTEGEGPSTAEEPDRLGTLFRLDLVTLTVDRLHVFSLFDGPYPYPGIVKGSDGIVYGTTVGFDSYAILGKEATIYAFQASSKTFEVLKRFEEPVQDISGLIQGDDGRFYGTIAAGGASNAGAIFAVDPWGSQLPGDCNQDGEINIADAICLYGYLFIGTTATPHCEM